MIDEPLTEADLDWIETEANPAAWIPGPEVLQHNHQPLPADLVFFAPPPTEIGEVISAWSTLTRQKRPMPALSRLLLVGLVGSLAYVVVGFAGLEVVFPILAALAVAALAWWLTSFKHKVSYVGQRGIARLTCRGRLDRIKKIERLLFDDAAELRTNQTRQYVNGVYSGTSYSFQWTDAGGRKRFKLSGTYRGEKKPPKPKDPFHFAESAELAWSLHLLGGVEESLMNEGTVRFPVGRSDSVSVGPGFLVLQRKDNQQRWTLEEIGGITVDNGTIKIKRLDAKENWFNSQGVFQFPYQRMANARLFLLTANRLLGHGTT